jgi:PAS domain S-box-containing protein
MNNLEIIQVPSPIIQKWQEIIDLLAEVLRVPSALIMKVEPPNIRVFVRSESEGNPFARDELACLNTGMYCDAVLKTRRLLLVPDALADQEWNANPDIKLGMISYMGVPVAWPNGDIFGTICILDSKRNEHSDLYKKFLFQCRDVLQADLTTLQAQTELELKVLERTAELRRSEVYLTEAQRLSRTGSFGWNVSSGEILWSDECFRIYGYDKSPSVTVGMILQRTHPEDLALAQRTLDRASSDGNDFDYEHRLLMPDGAVKHVHVAAHAIQDRADQLEFIGALIDITAAKRSAEELQKSQTELAHATRVTTLGELTASIAHEVSQPLCAIGAAAAASLRFLDRANPDLDEARSALRQIIMDGDRANEVIQRVRALAKKTDIQKVPLDLNNVIEEVMLIFRHEARSHGVSLRQELAPALPQVLGDRVSYNR